MSPPPRSKIPNGLLVPVTCQDLQYSYYMQYVEDCTASSGCREGVVCHCTRSSSVHFLWISKMRLPTKHASLEASLFRNGFRRCLLVNNAGQQRNTVCVVFFYLNNVKGVYCLPVPTPLRSAEPLQCVVKNPHAVTLMCGDLELCGFQRVVSRQALRCQVFDLPLLLHQQ